MTFHDERQAGVTPAILAPELQETIWFLGSLIRVRADGESTGERLAVLEHHGERGYGSPLHRHAADDETFLVLEGELRVEVAGQSQAAGAGALAFLPRGLPHAFVVTSPEARYLTMHTPSGFERFARTVGEPATPGVPPPDGPHPDLAELTAMAAMHGIEILGPKPSP